MLRVYARGRTTGRMFCQRARKIEVDEGFWIVYASDGSIFHLGVDDYYVEIEPEYRDG